MTNVQHRPPPRARLADVVASLSLAADLATGQRLEHGLRRALLAVWLGEELGYGDETLSEIYYVALLGSVGCTLEGAAFAHYVEDEIALGTQIVHVDPTNRRELAAFFLKRAGAGDPLLKRARKVVEVALAGPGQSALVCRDVAMQVGEMLDIGPAVREAVGQCHEQWDGKGWPRQLEGEAISLPARVYLLAHDIEIFSRRGGIDAALRVARRRSGTQYDPTLAACFNDVAAPLLARLETEAPWDGVLAAEPQPTRSLTSDDLDRVTLVIADFVDSRSVYTLGHSPAVAALARGAARALDLSEDDAMSLYRAGLLHDLGRTGVPVTTWDKEGALTRQERERIKQHPGLTELVLARSSALGHLGALAGLHHERLDGSGYRGMTAASLPVAGRVLAAADAYQTKLEARPHRDAMPGDAAASELRGQAARGLLDADAVDAVLAAAGHAREPRAQARPAGLTEREVEVLRLAVRGLSNRQMADELVVSPKTVGHHIEHIYEKIGVSTRVGAALFALRHGLVDETP